MTKTILTSIIAAVLAAVVTVKVVAPSGNGGSSAKVEESVYDRVMRTGEINCGYVVYPPAVIQDPNTGELSGIYPDTLNKLADTLSLKINWTEEVTWSTLAEGVASDRYDLFCSAAWPNGPRARVVEFSKPLYFSAIDIYTGIDENRFNSVDDMNVSDVSLSAVDGSTIFFMTKENFPEAKVHSLPEMSSHAEMIMDVVLKKADAVLAERSVAHDFSKNNPNTIKRFETDFPLVVNANTLVFKKGQDEFASMINPTIDMLHNQGTIERILKKYKPDNAEYFYSVAKPYQE